MNAGNEAGSPPRTRRLRRLGCAGFAVALVAFVVVVYGGGGHMGPGEIRGAALPVLVVAARAGEQAEAAGALGAPRRRVLFGDLHVHSTFSADAFMRSLPLTGGEGTHPPADACDYARYCSQLDFFALTDHAEAMTPEHWAESRASMRACDAIAPDDEPDLVAFLGFEWTQVGTTPADHYGHKNVIFRDLDEARLPTRPIAAPVPGDAFQRPPIANRWNLPLIPLLDFENRDRYMDVVHFLREVQGVPPCAEGVDVRRLPSDCREFARDPRELFAKLDQWGFESIVIPHGSTWGFYTPPGYTWDKQLDPALSDEDRQALVEVYSGHGNSEEYRAYRDVVFAPDGTMSCPPPTADHEPCCHRAGELIRARCGDIPVAECEARVREAQQNYLVAGVAGHNTIPDADAEDWGDCGQCRDCFLPAFNYRPGGSVQYMMARGHFAEDGTATHARFGFLASSDNHSSRPGTGYKDGRRATDTEVAGPTTPEWRSRVFGDPPPPEPRSQRLTWDDLRSRPPFALVDLERQSSFFLTGGLVAVLADGRDRASIWDALRERRVYGTSGDRILLWFDLLEGGVPTHGMGEEVSYGGVPRFRVQAVGAHRQRAGCPEFARRALGDARLAQLCGGECYQPDDTRKPIVRVEVVRIRRQRNETEDVATLIDDPFRVLPCAPSEAGCTVEFEDPDYLSSARDTLYYVRAIEEATDAVNGAGMRCDEEGRCEPCYADYRGDRADDCLAPIEERAWSSPIWLTFAPNAVVPGDAGVPAGPR